jgi:hypothetical protein
MMRTFSSFIVLLWLLGCSGVVPDGMIPMLEADPPLVFDVPGGQEDHVAQLFIHRAAMAGYVVTVDVVDGQLVVDAPLDIHEELSELLLAPGEVAIVPGKPAPDGTRSKIVTTLDGQDFIMTNRPLFDQNDISEATVEPVDANAVVITLTDDAAKELTTWTTKNTDKYLLVLMDGELLDAYHVNAGPQQSLTIASRVGTDVDGLGTPTDRRIAAVLNNPRPSGVRQAAGLASEMVVDSDSDAGGGGGGGGGGTSWGSSFFSNMSSGDCRGIASHESVYCDTNMCRGIASRESVYCDDDNCRGVAKGESVYCSSSLCRAWASHESVYCDFDDCRGVANRESVYCNSPQCRAIASGESVYCP